jgi:hypothetical protein
MISVSVNSCTQYLHHYDVGQGHQQQLIVFPFIPSFGIWTHERKDIQLVGFVHSRDSY